MTGRGGRFPAGLRTVARWLTVVGWMMLGSEARAHKTSDSYLRLAIDGPVVRGEWALALHDLEFAVGLDANGDGAITWGELKARRDAVLDYARGRVGVDLDGNRLDLRMDPDLQVDQLANGGYAVLRFEGHSDVAVAKVLHLEYRVFFDIDRLHRGLVRVEGAGTVQQAVFNPVDTRLRFEMAAPSPGRELAGFFREGVWHIWIGYDHLLFLLTLLLPAVLRRNGSRWDPVDGLGPALTNLVKVVTAFTVAHSITLGLAAAGWVRVSSRVIEPVIAASIVVAAVNNLRPVVTGRTWGIALAFGLVHGFGFASVLADLGLRPGALVRTLVGFNLGVEAGQLAVVGVAFPAIYAVRRSRHYPRLVLGLGSALVAMLAFGWMVERWRGG